MIEQAKSGAKATVVIVDDEQSILKELKILLGRMYNVHVFANPEEAERFVDDQPVDLVVSDEMMPEMRGSVLLARIHKKHPDICNIVLSGQAEKDDIVRAVNEGHIFSFLYKPAERQQLINVIEKGLENRNMKRILAEQNAQLKVYSENLEKMVEDKTAELVKAYDRLNTLDANKMYFLIYLSQEMDSSLDRIQKLAENLLNYFAFAGSELKMQQVKRCRSRRRLPGSCRDCRRRSSERGDRRLDGGCRNRGGGRSLSTWPGCSGPCWTTPWFSPRPGGGWISGPDGWRAGCGCAWRIPARESPRKTWARCSNPLSWTGAAAIPEASGSICPWPAPSCMPLAARYGRRAGDQAVVRPSAWNLRPRPDQTS